MRAPSLRIDVQQVSVEIDVAVPAGPVTAHFHDLPSAAGTSSATFTLMLRSPAGTFGASASGFPSSPVTVTVAAPALAGASRPIVTMAAASVLPPTFNA